MAVDYGTLKKGGFMRQKQKNNFSLRIAVVGGTLTAENLKKIAEVAEEHGEGYVHLTSRQGVEIPFIKLEDIDVVKEELAEGGCKPGVCGPRVRTVTACQGNAVCPSGNIDTQDIAKKLDERYFGRELPHKFKFGVTGCRNNCLKAEENDVGIKGATKVAWKEDETAYEIHAGAVLVATGGAAGLYKPNNPGFSRHKMWYPPFNTGAGYAMGIRAGAEMTSFEMRFIALRCKDTIAPTGTIAQGVGAKQINSKGFVYEDKYGLTTSERVYGTVRENQLGNGPCYLKTSGIDKDQEENLLKAYLNMAPSQTLKWIETGELPGEQDVEIEGTEPYIVGGHTASGYWVDTNRETTIHGLYAAGDVAGGCPQKYVTGALAEGELAAKAIEKQLSGTSVADGADEEIARQAQEETAAYQDILAGEQSPFTAEELEEAMQKVMDEYAGGISTHYQYNEKQLKLADEKIDQLTALADELTAQNMHELLFVYELKERLIVCKSLIAHLRGRKETRWHSFNENLDHPNEDENFFKYVNSRLEDGKIRIILRDIVKEGSYEHTN